MTKATAKSKVSSEKVSCPWSLQTGDEAHYHHTEWGVPCWDDKQQFEFLILEAAQAGLSWRTILAKRAGYRKAFAGFDPQRVARFNAKDEQRLMNDSGIIRNRKKIQAAINNARCFLQVQEEFGTFCNYLWGFVDNKPVKNAWQRQEDVPAQTPLSQCIAKDLKKRGFKFLGPVVVYAHLQATGLINDHLLSCFRYNQV